MDLLTFNSKAKELKRVNPFLLLQFSWLISSYYFLILSFLEIGYIRSLTFYDKFSYILNYNEIILNFIENYKFVIMIFLLAFFMASISLTALTSVYFGDYISLRAYSKLGFEIFLWGFLILINYFLYLLLHGWFVILFFLIICGVYFYKEKKGKI
jgi:hypothetical protein